MVPITNSSLVVYLEAFKTFIIVIFIIVFMLIMLDLLNTKYITYISVEYNHSTEKFLLIFSLIVMIGMDIFLKDLPTLL